MKFLTLILILTSSAVFASFDKAPPNFSNEGRRAIFVDFIEAKYNLLYDARRGKAVAVSFIKFKQLKKGYPLFDLVEDPLYVKLNGVPTKEELISVPGNVSKMRRLNKQLEPGTYTLEVKNTITTRTRFDLSRDNWGNVSSAFFIRDLRDRMFLEQYLPTNYEYDQYKMEIEVQVVGTRRWHSLFTNGEVTKINENHYRVEYPDFYTASALYFHLVPINKFVRWYLKYDSIDGREIPITIYSASRLHNKVAERKARRVFKELEKDYGPYPYKKLIIYATGIKGGMEYAGATETSVISLGHELHHFYFAKGVFPANGNSGWLDEAIASWRDKGYQTNELPFYQAVNLANHSVYTRKTDSRSYEYGRSFLSYIDQQLKNIGKQGLKDFLKEFYSKRKFTTVTTEDFKSDLENYAQMSFSRDFFQYIYGGDGDESHKYERHENPHHPLITEEELDGIL